MSETEHMKLLGDTLINSSELGDIDKLLMVNGCIRTSTGKYIDFNNIHPSDICIEDIAHSLSMQCRFGGHLPVFYSVAQHSVHCSQLVDEEYAFEALMHDASEAYMLDIPKPLKNLLPDYERLEDKMMGIISDKYGIDHPLNPPTKEVDALMLKLEFKSIMMGRNLFEVWDIEESKKRFLERYKELT